MTFNCEKKLTIKYQNDIQKSSLKKLIILSEEKSWLNFLFHR